MRLIPARAGKTPTFLSAAASWSAHPRAGGENYGASGVPYCAMGSSPRGRGKPRPCSSRPRTCRAHPRAGGENPDSSEVSPRNGGSSPRGRGKQPADGLRCRCVRLIPARAGKTRRSVAATWFATAHPRAGGENHGEHFGGGLVQGSSPRGRGKPPWRRGSGGTGRLIPARAGKTSRPPVAS